MSHTVSELKDALALRLPAAHTLTAEDDLIAEGLLDSLLIMDLMTFIEGRYGVRMGPEDVTPSTFQTLGTLAAVVDARRIPLRQSA